MKSFEYNSIDEYQLEITTHCNTACPQCPRNINGGSVNPYLRVEHLSRKVIDEIFPEVLCKRMRQIFFCGSYGDPIMHPEFKEIVEDFKTKYPPLWIYVHTNGGIRDLTWWYELGRLMKDGGRIDFNIDGVATNDVYRRGVTYEEVAARATQFILGGGTAHWNYIVFEHNEHEIELAEKLSKRIGFEKFNIRKTGRFLNQTTMTELDSWPVLNQNDLKLPSEKYRNNSMLQLEQLRTEYPNMRDYFNETQIKCDALSGKKVVITAEGLVLPCNFFEHNLYDARFKQLKTELPGANNLHFVDGKNQVESLINKYGREELSVHRNSLKQIFQSGFWTELIESWEKDLDNGRIFECAMTCGQKLTKVWDQSKMNITSLRYFVTGNNRGLGLALSAEFKADGCNRTTGLDITKEEDIQKIAKESLHYDVFINNAFDGPPNEPWANYGQVNLLHAVFKMWKENNKDGYIINIGSSGSKSVVAPGEWETYRVAKAALEYASKQCTKDFENNNVKFKTTLLTPARLDTPLSRSRDSWTGNGIAMTDMVNTINYITSFRDNTVIDEIIISLNLNYGK